MLRYINDSSRKLYAFEMASLDSSLFDTDSDPSNSKAENPDDIFSHVDTFNMEMEVSVSNGNIGSVMRRSNSAEFLDKTESRKSVTGFTAPATSPEPSMTDNDGIESFTHPVAFTATASRGAFLEAGDSNGKGFGQEDSRGARFGEEDSRGAGFSDSEADLDVTGTGLWAWGAKPTQSGSLETEPGESWEAADTTQTGTCTYVCFLIDINEKT